jgi:hypothetical protein
VNEVGDDERVSSAAFADGAALRIEIPSVEGPVVLEQVLDAAASYGVTVNRVSQGSGAMLLTDAELRRMAELGASHGVEVCLFVGPRGSWDTGVFAHLPDGSPLAGAVRGNEQMRYALADIERAVELGIRGFLVADLGLLREVVRRQADGGLPAGICWKVSAYLAVANASTVSLLEELGATTVNVPSDLPVGQLREMRAASSLPLDIYVEAPDSMGGTVRVMEVAELVAAGAPLHAKFGLSNVASVYPAGGHLEATAVAAGREKVRRAAIAMEWLDRFAPGTVQSAPHAAGACVPVAPGAGQ